MKLNRLHCIFILALILIAGPSKAQQDTVTAKLSRFVKNIQSFNRQYPQEKVYLHFDNTGYYLGETIWFKAYVVKADELSPTPLSRVLYVELLNPEGDIVETKKLKVENGQCHGDFQLKDSLFAGYYEVRAYTRYMLNFGNTEYLSCPSLSSAKINYKKYTPKVYGDYLLYPTEDRHTDYRRNKMAESQEFLDKIGIDDGIRYIPLGILEKRCSENEILFSRVFPVYNRPDIPGNYSVKNMYERPRRNQSTEPKKEAPKVMDFGFYPEGGNLVIGLNSKIAFKAFSNEQENLNIKGVVRNASGKNIAQLSTLHQGMGSFNLIPDGQDYTAEVYYKNEVLRFALPKAEAEGYVLSANPLSSDILTIGIEKKGSQSEEALGLTICCRGKLTYSATLAFVNNQSVKLNIPNDKLETGVNQITLFDSHGKIHAERLVFINNEDYSENELTASTKKTLFQPYEPIDVSFGMQDVLGQPQQATFSVAIRDAETEDLTYHTDNIQTNLLLSSDLKGYIANPAYYLEANDEQHRSHLDLLMLTQGWRRYAWKEMAGVDTFKLKQPLEKGFFVEGSVNEFYIDETPELPENITETSNNPNDLNTNNTSSSLSSPIPTVVNSGKYSGTSKSSLTDHETESTYDRVPFIHVKMSLKDTKGQMKYGDLKTDKEGSFKALAGDIYGNTELTLVALKDTTERKLKMRDYLISLNRTFSPDPKTAFSFYQTNVPFLAKGSGTPGQRKDSLLKVQKLNTVTVKGKKSNRNVFDYSNPNYRLSAQEEIDKIRDIIFLEEDYKKREYEEKEIFKYACIRRGFSNIVIKSIQDFPYDCARRYTFSDMDSIYIYSDLASRKRFSTPEELEGGKVPDIVIKIKSFKTNQPRRTERGIRRAKIQGYSYLSEFYSPDYKNNALPEKKDFRRTLYWNPDVKTDSNGRATVSFFNNSTCKRINISAETVTKEGVPVVYRPPVP